STVGRVQQLVRTANPGVFEISDARAAAWFGRFVPAQEHSAFERFHAVRRGTSEVNVGLVNGCRFSERTTHGQRSTLGMAPHESETAYVISPPGRRGELLEVARGGQLLDLLGVG